MWDAPAANTDGSRRRTTRPHTIGQHDVPRVRHHGRRRQPSIVLRKTPKRRTALDGTPRRVTRADREYHGVHASGATRHRPYRCGSAGPPRRSGGNSQPCNRRTGRSQYHKWNSSARGKHYKERPQGSRLHTRQRATTAQDTTPAVRWPAPRAAQCNKQCSDHRYHNRRTPRCHSSTAGSSSSRAHQAQERSR